MRSHRMHLSAATHQSSSQLSEIETFGPNPGALRMLVYAPPGLARRAPLVVVLHGCTQTAESYAVGAGWLTLAERFGFVVVCPEQRRTNNLNLCFNWFQPPDASREIGEAASIQAMVRHAIATHGLDRKRVFITGLSAGAAMANVMLSIHPEVFAAGALIAGLPYGAASTMREAFVAMRQAPSQSGREWGDKVRAASDHRGPWPRVSIWQGDADNTVHPDASDNLVRQWTNVHALRGPARPAKSADGRSYAVWRSSDGGLAVELHRIAGMGHGTPLKTAGADGYGTVGPFLLEVGVSSSREIAEGWRLAPAMAPPRLDAQRNASPQDTWRQPRPTVAGAGPGDVIATALRAAGLMK